MKFFYPMSGHISIFKIAHSRIFPIKFFHMPISQYLSNYFLIRIDPLRDQHNDLMQGRMINTLFQDLPMLVLQVFLLRDTENNTMENFAANIALLGTSISLLISFHYFSSTVSADQRSDQKEKFKSQWVVVTRKQEIPFLIFVMYSFVNSIRSSFRQKDLKYD